jgi:hypothetical protein
VWEDNPAFRKYDLGNFGSNLRRLKDELKGTNPSEKTKANKPPKYTTSSKNSTKTSNAKKKTKSNEQKLKPWQHSDAKKKLAGKLMSSTKHKYWGMESLEIYEDDEDFQKYEFRNFKSNVNWLKGVITEQLKQINFENSVVANQIALFPCGELTNCGRPYWDTSKARPLLEDDIACELEKKKANKEYKIIKPKKLRKQHPEYLEWEPTLFSKIFHDELKKQHGQVFWVEKRNKVNMKKYLKKRAELRKNYVVWFVIA